MRHYQQSNRQFRNQIQYVKNRLNSKKWVDKLFDFEFHNNKVKKGQLINSYILENLQQLEEQIKAYKLRMNYSRSHLIKYSEGQNGMIIVDQKNIEKILERIQFKQIQSFEDFTLIQELEKIIIIIFCSKVRWYYLHCWINN
ncbi:unnamed protein product [Paramecium sonneborni]|uniref:Uncharacterized protein n=1 Tax=Paramecium sonneborni TaxID=65129 RepID=A0A8S1RPE6_9CILI|nr:unnamed protein product [Paramecium sonneborni]